MDEVAVKNGFQGQRVKYSVTDGNPISSVSSSGEKSFVRVGGRDVLRNRQNGA
jgi:hypothetical protein